MASKKKRPSPRPQSGSRPPAKRPGPPAKGGAQGPAKSGGGGGDAPAAKAGPKQGGGGKAPPRPDGAAKAVPKRGGGGAKAAPKPARERTGPTRAERLAAAEKARQRKAARTRALIAGGLVAVLALLTITIINSRRSNSRVISALEASGACNYDSRSDDDAGAGKNHVNGNLTYTVNPPSGGDHNPSAAPAGVFTAESRPPDAQIVHALEHGFVAIWYRPDLDVSGLDQLRELARKYEREILLVPRESLTQPVAATAWHRRLLCSRPDVGALDQFVKAYRDKAPEKGFL